MSNITITQACSANLIQIRELIDQLQIEKYNHPSKWIFGSSIGQHVRHILEFYICLFEQQEEGNICYDLRRRDGNIESNPNYALETINSLSAIFDRGVSDKALKLVSNFDLSNKREDLSDTSMYRELAYCLEHSIHHQALIKVGLLEIELAHLVDDDFGIAPSTIRSRVVLQA